MERREQFKRMTGKELVTYFEESGLGTIDLETLLLPVLKISEGIRTYSLSHFEPATPTSRSLLYSLDVTDFADNKYPLILKHYPEWEETASISGTPRFRVIPAFEGPLQMVLTEEKGLVIPTCFNKVLNNGKDNVICMKKYYTDAKTLFDTVLSHFKQLNDRYNELDRKKGKNSRLMDKVGFVIELLIDAYLINTHLINENISRVNRLADKCHPELKSVLHDTSALSLSLLNHSEMLKEYAANIIQFAKKYWQNQLRTVSSERLGSQIDEKISFPLQPALDFIAKEVSEPSIGGFNHFILDFRPAHFVLTSDIYFSLEELIFNPSKSLDAFKKQIGYDSSHHAILEFKNPLDDRNNELVRAYSGIAQIDMDYLTKGVPSAFIWAGFIPGVYQILSGSDKLDDLSRHFIAEELRLNEHPGINLDHTTPGEHAYAKQFLRQFRAGLKEMFMRALSYKIRMEFNPTVSNDWKKFRTEVEAILTLPAEEEKLSNPLDSFLKMLVHFGRDYTIPS